MVDSMGILNAGPFCTTRSLTNLNVLPCTKTVVSSWIEPSLKRRMSRVVTRLPLEVGTVVSIRSPSARRTPSSVRSAMKPCASPSQCFTSTGSASDELGASSATATITARPNDRPRAVRMRTSGSAIEVICLPRRVPRSSHRDEQPPLFRGLAVEVLFRGVRVGLGDVHRAVDVLRRTVDRVQLQRLLAGVPDVVARAGGDDDGHVVLELRPA